MTTNAHDNTVEVIERKQVYHHPFLNVTEARLRYRRADGQMSDEVTRLVVQHSDAVGVLAYDPQADVVVLVRQFRYPVYSRLHAQASNSAAAWLLEIVAGLLDGDQSAEETARRELREEIGYEVTGALEQIATVYSSPGSLAEQITLFIAEVDTTAQHGHGGGLAEEGEDTELVKLPVDEALAMLARGDVRDAKTVIALQSLALRRAGDNNGQARR
ncbi:MAG TPA: NUDIX hydrolase [Roseiflexaceae bacterium]|jgi:nudix-type nucleoside diphosphatase (YffH/AdpP family)|nr:NUDIX hydrolase [Roseiflexaceae bacterium]